jgi:hypothetical protein
MGRESLRTLSLTTCRLDAEQPPRLPEGRVREVTRVPISSLSPADSPRISGESADHVRILAEAETALPAILVHRATMRVIDGMHRLRAAVLKNEETIEVEFFDGNAEEAFLAAVQANVSHGLPLTLAERRSAAARIITSCPARSDRSIAAITGLAAGTVGSIRRQINRDGAGPRARVGRDGRVRPVSSAEGRRIARDVLAGRPDASLRDVAKAAGISPSTVRDVRERISRGDDPVPLTQRIDHDVRECPPEPAQGQQAGAESRRHGLRRPVQRDRATLMSNLSKDPSLRLNESGRAVLRWLVARAGGTEGWEEIVDRIPPHCTYVVAELARSCADDWAAFATQLEQFRRPAVARSSRRGERPGA